MGEQPRRASMYSQLLTASLEHRGSPLDGDAQRKQALADYIKCRNELHFGELLTPATNALLVRADRIALQLRYDLALMRVCQQQGIASDPSKFVKPLSERRRLEAALAESGFDLDQAEVGKASGT